MTSRLARALPLRLVKSDQFQLRKNRCLIHTSSASSAAKVNKIINFVPQQEAWVIERMGKFHKVLEPGLNILIPVLDEISFVQSLREIAIDIPKQSAITIDNVQVQLDGVLYLRVHDPYKASYGVEDPEFAVTQLAQTTMRSEVGKISLETVFREREALNVNIVDAINKAAEPWGIRCLRYEIRDMTMPVKIQEAMQMQVEAERRKRAQILESEGQREAAINVAEGEAKALQVRASARALAVQHIAEALQKKGGPDAAALIVAEQYVQAFSGLAKEGNTILLPANLNEPASMVAQALRVYQSLSAQQGTRDVTADHVLQQLPKN